MIPTTKAGIFIVLLIWFFSLWGLVELLYEIFVRLRFERRELEKVHQNSNNLSNGNEPSVLSGELLADASNKSAIYHRIQSIIKIKEQNGAINQNSLSDILVGRQSILGGFPRHILSILIILGLIGTLVGLIEAVKGAKPMSDPSQLTDLRQIAHIVGGTLSGMRTAFYTTFWGLVCTLFLGLVSYRFNKRQSLFLIDLENFTTTDLIPRFFPDNTNKIAEFSDSLANTSSSIDAAMKKLTDVAWEIRLDESQQLVVSLEESSRKLSERLQDLSDTQYQIKEIFKSLNDVVNTLKSSQHEMAATLNQLIPDLALKNKNLNEALDSYKVDQETNLNHLLENIAKTIDERNAVLSRELSNLFQNLSDKVVQVDSDQHSIAYRMNELINKLNIMLDSFDTMIKESVGSGIFDQIKLLQEISAALSQLQSLPQAIQGLLGNSEEQMKADNSLITQFHSSVEELRKISSQLPNEILIQKMSNTLDELNKNIRQMNVNMETNVNRNPRRRFFSFWKRDASS